MTKPILIAFVIVLISHASSAFDGQLHIINPRLTTGANVIAESFNMLFQEPGPTRVRIRQMVEALVGKTRNGRAFNPSIAPYKNGYLLSVRVVYHTNPGEELVPGNRSASKFEKGKNFWWQDFSSPNFSGGTVYFHADANLEKFIFMAPMNYNALTENIMRHDIRLIGNNNIVTFSPPSSIIASKLKVNDLNSSLSLGLITFSDPLYNRKPGNNYGAIHIDMDQKRYSYIDWFYKKGVRFTKINGSIIHHDYLAYHDENYPLLGTGSTLEDGQNAGSNSGIMPLFSLGSSHLKLDDQTYLGVGHTKIHVDEDLYTYRPGSNIDRFRRELAKELKTHYGDRYIRHDAYNSSLDKSQGYHYLMYFYTFKLDDDNKPIEMKISDSFLPIDVKAAGNPDNYVFSLVFPMGIAPKFGDDKTVLVSAGIGDYYAAILELPIDFLMASCRHDVQNLDLNSYEYKLMRFDGEGSFEIADRLQ